MTGVGLIGCGRIASAVHLRVLARLRGIELVAVADPDPEARHRAESATRARVYAGAGELLADPRVEAVVVCAPPAAQADLAVAAAGAGKHLYLEKPIATNAADGVRVVAAAEEAGITSAVGFNRRAHPLFEQGRELVGAGRIGRVQGVFTSFCEPLGGPELPEWKRQRESGGGVLLDLASHHFDLIRWLLGTELVSVEASLRSDASEHDSGWVDASLAGGIEVRSFFSFHGPSADVVELVGDQGVLRLDRYLPPALLSVPRGQPFAMRRARVSPSADVASWRLQRLIRPAVEPSYRRSLARWVRRLHGEPADLATLNDGLRSLEAVLAAERSALTRAPVGVGS